MIAKFQAGYEAGVKSVCPDCTVLVKYAGATPDAFNDPAKGKEISLQQINQGADIIYHAAGNTGAGLFDAASQEKGSSPSASTSTRPSCSPKTPSLPPWSSAWTTLSTRR